MSTDKRYERDQRSKSDKGQVKFNSNGWLEKSEPPKIEQFNVANPNEMVMCPFCLYTAQLKAFFVSTKKGISTGKASCPECKSGMLMRTLLADMTAEQYAEFVFNYRKSGFWQKCPFKKWRERLKEIGWSGAFWEKYKALKGENKTDNVFDDAERMARDYGIDVHERS